MVSRFSMDIAILEIKKEASPPPFLVLLA